MRRRLVFILTNVLSIACLWWVLHDQKWADFWADLQTLKWWWVLVAVIADVLVYVVQGWRWSVLLRPVEVIGVSRSVRAVYVGLFANEILPFRTGEIIRGILQSEWSSIPISVSLSSIVVERVFDGFWLVVAAAIAVRFNPEIPNGVSKAAYALAGLVLLLALVLGLAMFHKHRMHAMLTGRGWFQRNFLVLVEDLYLIGHSRYLYYSALISALYLALQLLPFYAMMKAYGLVDVTWAGVAMITVAMRFSSAIPQAPGNLGTFQLLLARLLETLGYGSDFAPRFAFLMWAVVTVPLLLVGSVALIITGARISELHQRAKSGTPVLKS